MSPTNLGDLPSNQPAPTGLCQIKRGAYNGVYNFTSASGVQPISDGASGFMRINITPSRAGWWLIRAESIWLVSDPNWYYCHWGVRLSPADVNGYSDDRNHMCLHSALSWNESCINTAYRLSAGVAYYAEMFWPAARNGSIWGLWLGPDYTYIMGEFVEDGSL